MSTGILIVSKEAAGETWANTYGISVGSSDGPLTLADLGEIVGSNPTAGLTDATTDPSNAAYGGATSIIAAILGFERRLHYHQVRFTQLNLADGATPGDPTGSFWSKAVNFVGLRDFGSLEEDGAIAPLNVAMLVSRNAAFLSIKPGRIYYRACLLDNQVKIGSRVGVTWAVGTYPSDMAGLVNTLQVSTHLQDYTSVGALVTPPIFLSIPHIAPKSAPNAGQVVSGSIVSNLTTSKPVSRQLTRGRRRAASV